MEFKLVISNPKTGQSYLKDVKEPNASSINGLKIGQTFKGESVDLPGYEFEITGGSDIAGFPMRKDVRGSVRKKIPIVKGIGLRRNKRKGLRVLKTVAGNTIYEKTAEVNVKILKEGREKLVAKEKTEEKKK
ncbi:MAG: S6e family ribosomal protein [Nanoarchaeota archaeon]|nr:S6e family ribosomal protein [Nanoarchaeota archaeon]